ncbi:MAG TPA: penicillin-binding protein [Candidatus Binataceae bacterium]|nr:penicillin-binding protein [Candidatus Binataceae bacterium]
MFKQRRARIGVLTAALGAMLAVVAVRLMMLVLIDGPRLASMATNEQSGELELAAVRGDIVDRNGRLLASMQPCRSAYVRPRQLLEKSTSAERARLAAALGVDADALEARLKSPAPFVWLSRRLESAQADEIEGLHLAGVSLAPENVRAYPEGSLAAAVVGQAGLDGQGLSGLELQYDRVVRGEAVKLRFYHDAHNHPIFDSPVELSSARPGARLELTIDAAIQADAENSLRAEVRSSGARHGTAIVLDPFTGEVLALAGASADPARDGERLHDAAVEDAFEPGSTVKGLLGAIALDDHAIDTRQQFYCENGAWQFGGKTIHDDSPHGWLDLAGIVEVSSNIGAAKIARTLGAERYYAGLQAFGIGRRSGIDLPGESAGLIRSPAHWRPVDLADHGFGQGIGVTPIQLAVAYAAIANGGVVMRPYVVKSITDASGTLRHTPQVLRRAVSPAAAHTMNDLLRNVVSAPDGTGRLAQVANFTVAGKTGTAQMVNPATGAYYQNRLVASFVGFVPAKDPRLVILVVLYDVPDRHFGGLYAAPIFSQIATAALGHLDVEPERPATTLASILPLPGNLDGAFEDARKDAPDRSSASGSDDQFQTARAGRAAASGLTPNFLGLSLRGALALARAESLNPEIEGAGYVTAQTPAPGLPVGSAMKLVLADAAETSSMRLRAQRSVRAASELASRRRR